MNAKSMRRVRGELQGAAIADIDRIDRRIKFVHELNFFRGAMSFSRHQRLWRISDP